MHVFFALLLSPYWGWNSRRLILTKVYTQHVVQLAYYCWDFCFYNVITPKPWPFNKILKDPYFILRVTMFMSFFIRGLQKLFYVQHIVGLMVIVLAFYFFASGFFFFRITCICKIVVFIGVSKTPQFQTRLLSSCPTNRIIEVLVILVNSCFLGLLSQLNVLFPCFGFIRISVSLRLLYYLGIISICLGAGNLFDNFLQILSNLT